MLYCSFKKYVFLALSFCILFTLTLFSTGGAWADEPNDRWEFWNSNSLEMKLNNRLEGTLAQEYRFHNNDNYYRHTDLSLTHKINDRFDLGIGYRNIIAKKKAEAEKEDRPYLFGTYQITKSKRFEMEYRGTLEYRFRPKEETILRARHRLTFSFPTKIGQLKVAPYIADEIFQDLNGQDAMDLIRNRLYVGINGEIIRNVKLDLFYLRQSSEKDIDSGEIWNNFNVFGAKVKLEL